MMEGEKPMGKGEWKAAVLLLLALLGIFFYPSLLGGKILSCADSLYNFPPWKFHLPEPDYQPANPLLGDQVLQFYPWMKFTAESLRGGEIPLWNPYSYCGAPFVGNDISAVFFPLNFLFYVFSSDFLYGVVACCKIFFAGLFMFLFVRSLGAGFFGGILSGAAFGFSGFLILWLNHPQTNVAIFLPGLFYCLERILQGEGKRVRWLYTLLLALFIGLQFLGGHIETSLHILSAAWVYFFARLFWLRGRVKGWIPFLHILLAFFLGTGLGLIQLLPSAEYILQCERWAGVDSGTVPSFQTSPPLGILLRMVVALFLPQAFGSPLRHNFKGFVEEDLYFNFNEINGAYAGVVSFTLVFFAFWLGRRKRAILPLGVLGLLSFMVIYRVPPISHWVYSLPFFNVTDNRRFLLVLGFSLSALAGLGGDGILRMEREEISSFRRGLSVLAASIPLLGVLLLISLGPLRDALERWTGSTDFSRALLLFLGFFTGSVLAHLLLRERGFLYRAALFSLLVADLFVFGRGYNPSVEPEKIYPETLSIRVLKEKQRESAEPFRILAIPFTLPPNSHQFFHLSSPAGYDAVEVTRYRKFFSILTQGKTPYFYLHQIRKYDRAFYPVIDLMNVRYLAARYGAGGGGKAKGRFTLVLDGRGEELTIYENRTCLPRAFLMKKLVAIKEEREILEQIGRIDFQPDESLILEEEVPDFKGGELDEPSPAILAYENNRVLVRAEPREEAFLVLLDTYFPGWKVRVRPKNTEEWKEEKLYRAYYTFRAVRLSPGEQEVEFSYEPVCFRVGAFASVFFLLLLVAGFLRFLAIPQKNSA